MSYSRIKEKFDKDTPVILDGGIGTEVVRRGIRWRQHGIEDAPQVIRQIHIDYLRAGADVITSHTFNLTKRNFINFFRDAQHMAEIGAPGLETKARHLCREAVSLAREALAETARDGLVPIAGSISPVNHLFRPDLSPGPDESYDHHKECAQVLADAGVDLIFLEAMNTVEEMTAAIRGAREQNLPVWVSLIPDVNAHLLSGESLPEAAAVARREGADAVLLSAALPDIVSRGLPSILNGGPCGAKALIGRYSPPSWKPDFYPRFVNTDETPPDKYATLAKEWISTGARIVGGSSGTTPEHIAAVKKAVSESHDVQRS